MGFLSDSWDSLTGKAQSQGAAEAGRLEREQLDKAQDYLMERDALGNQYGDAALEGLGNLFTGDQSYQEGMIEKAEASPLYQRMMLAKEDAKQQVAGDASMTGGLRSGNAVDALYKTDLRYDSDALNQAYDRQLEGLSGLTGQRDRQTGNIADIYGDKGRSLANQATAQADAKGSLLSNGLKIAGTVGSFFSDPRLKSSIEELGTVNGQRIFKWKWNDEAEALGLSGDEVGVLAHLVNREHPEAVGHTDGYLTVNYEALGLDHEALNTMENIQ